MKRVTGIGGIFFKAQDPEKLKAWYQEHLGLEPDSEVGGVAFKWREADQPETIGRTVWSPFPADTKYFAPSQASFMINYRVVDLDRCWISFAVKASKWMTELKSMNTADSPG